MENRCGVCEKYKAKQSREEPMIPHEVPQRPWQKVGIDIFEIKSDHYIMFVDYYSNFTEINKLSNMKSSAVITCCKQQFARYGILDVLMSDNGPQYASP